MTTIYHSSYPAIRHRELIVAASVGRQRNALRRLARAERRARRAAAMSLRAAELVDRTHR